MFHNIDPALAGAAVLVVIIVAFSIIGSYVARELSAALEDSKNADREGVARATGMIDTNQYN